MVKKTLQSSEYDQDDEKVVFENEAGRALLEEITESMNNLFRVTSKIKALENDVKSLRQHEKTLQVKLSLLTNQYREYLCIRERFLDTFKRDILKNKSDQNIKAGNSVAVHGGDAVTDAYLYRSGKRQDERIFVKIYGLTAAQVEQLCKYSGLYHTLVQQSYLI
jgi:predicted membrane protein